MIAGDDNPRKYSFQTNSCSAQPQQTSQLQHDMDYFYCVYLDCVLNRITNHWDEGEINIH